MSLKSIIAAASGESADAELLSVVAELAARFGAHVRVAPAFNDPAGNLVFYGAALGQGTPDMLARVNASMHQTLEKLQSLARDVAAQHQLAPSALVVETRALQPRDAVASAAVLADLVAFNGAAARSPALADLFAETLIGMRAPCFIANGGAYAFGATAIAWDGSAQAGRAVRTALPLLQSAARVVVLQNADDGGLDPDAAALDPLNDYLSRQSVMNVTTRVVRGANVAASLLGGAREEQCELLVAGAYGRPRLYELALGGTTRSLVHAENAPHLLLVH